MSAFTTRIEIEAPADEVFAYVTDLSRMPEYLPTVKEATAVGGGRIRMQGEEDGHSYDTIGWYQIHELNRTMLWGSEGQKQYNGDLEVMDQHGACVLTINLNFQAMPLIEDDGDRKLEARGPEIQKGLEDSAQAIKKSCEAVTVSPSDKTHGYVS